MTTKIRVLLVDDHNVVRSGLRRLLELGGDIEIVAEADSGEQACLIYNDFLADVLVMDLSMPGIGGFEALRRILAIAPNAKIVIFTMHENTTFATQALSAGARGYVAKSGLADDLLLAVREAAAGKTYISPNIAQKMVLQTISGEQDPIQKLSTREFEVFTLLAEGVSVEGIASTLNISQKTAANYQTILKQKLGISNAVELVRLAIQHGMIID
ncbi:MAG: response regulator transcription factor [Methylotenera sp.]|uniref:response regulator transcription factor n=1 Tax=Methylotenera sp. TaxID=2051956 RepID=UPI002488C914|nr:response regulator transcription factor [Methylotenera sp.]MDI1308948.1 response regulator transcription factor [Methylotenera sp.]